MAIIPMKSFDIPSLPTIFPIARPCRTRLEAEPLSLFDLLRVAQIRVFRLNIVGAGLGVLGFHHVAIVKWLIPS